MPQQRFQELLFNVFTVAPREKSKNKTTENDYIREE
jgi:hypothetical protein